MFYNKIYFTVNFVAFSANVPRQRINTNPGSAAIASLLMCSFVSSSDCFLFQSHQPLKLLLGTTWRIRIFLSCISCTAVRTAWIVRSRCLWHNRDETKMWLCLSWTSTRCHSPAKCLYHRHLMGDLLQANNYKSGQFSQEILYLVSRWKNLETIHKFWIKYWYYHIFILHKSLRNMYKKILSIVFSAQAKSSTNNFIKVIESTWICKLTPAQLEILEADRGFGKISRYIIWNGLAQSCYDGVIDNHLRNPFTYIH